MSVSVAIIEDQFKAHEKFLWGVSYRLTGNAADADDIVQETFIRAIKTPPARTDEPWRPWLARVAVNIGRDVLRQRKRRGYSGQWLPSPIETEEAIPSYEPEQNPATRYDLLESISLAFLIALEVLTPTRRAVLLLRDVFDYSVRETAEALGMSEPNVKTTHHRARHAMQEYDHSRLPLTKSLQEKTRQMMEQFLSCLIQQDVVGAAALLTEDARQISDGGGEFIAARLPIIGRDKIILFNRNLQKNITPNLRYEWRLSNGIPSLITEMPDAEKGYAKRWVLMCSLNQDGQIERIYNVLATRKLTAIQPLQN